MPLLVLLSDCVLDASRYEAKTAQMICNTFPQAGGPPTLPLKKISYSRPEFELRQKLKAEGALNLNSETVGTD